MWEFGGDRMVISRVEIRQMTGGIYRFASHPYARNLPLLLIGLWFVWLLLPSGVNIPFFALLPIFFIATGVGVVSGVPGGVGPFEVMCLTLLPVNQPEPVLAAIFGYRLVYYFLPALLAVALLMTREWRGGDIGLGISSLNAPNFARKVPTKLAALIDVAQRADARLIHAQDFSILPNPRRSAFLLSAETGNSLLAVSDPLGPQKDWPELMMALKSEARQRNVRPLIYKCGHEAAKLAQQAGFTAHRIGHEAVLNPQKYSVKGSKMRGLRRKLRQVEKAGIRIEACDDAILPLAQMHKVSREWAGCNGKARGFSMGRFHIHNTRHHRFFLAWQGGSLIGFIGLWHTQHEMSLDLMRSKAAAPSGVMQALVHHAILEAAMQGRVRFSLASVPFLPIDRPETLVEHFCNWLYRFCPNRHCGPGLYQFKQGFRPEWKPRYLAATSLAAAALGGFDIARRIEQREYTD
jgi:phosphatidylglycerol lysyltransferase